MILDLIILLFCMINTATNVFILLLINTGFDAVLEIPNTHKTQEKPQ